MFNYQNDFGVRYVRNNSGQDLPRHSILKVDGVEVTPTQNDVAWKNGQIIDGGTPTANAPFCITQRAIRDGDSGPAVVVGVSACKVSVGTESDEFADSGTSTTALTSGTTGARILWKESGTGTKNALVALAPGAEGQDGTSAVISSALFSGSIPVSSGAPSSSVSFYQSQSSDQNVFETVGGNIEIKRAGWYHVSGAGYIRQRPTARDLFIPDHAVEIVKTTSAQLQYTGGTVYQQNWNPGMVIKHACGNLTLEAVNGGGSWHVPTLQVDYSDADVTIRISDGGVNAGSVTGTVAFKVGAFGYIENDDRIIQHYGSSFDDILVEWTVGTGPAIAQRVSLKEGVLTQSMSSLSISTLGTGGTFENNTAEIWQPFSFDLLFQSSQNQQVGVDLSFASTDPIFGTPTHFGLYPFPLSVWGGCSVTQILDTQN